MVTPASLLCRPVSRSCCRTRWSSCGSFQPAAVWSPTLGRAVPASRSCRPRPSSTRARTLSCSRTRPPPACAPGTRGTPAGSSCSHWATTDPSGGWSTPPHRPPSSPAQTTSGQDSGSGGSEQSDRQTDWQTDWLTDLSDNYNKYIAFCPSVLFPSPNCFVTRCYQCKESELDFLSIQVVTFPGSSQCLVWRPLTAHCAFLWLSAHLSHNLISHIL